MVHFVKYIQDYGSALNYDIAQNKIVHKHFFRAFYRRTNKKKYKLQVLKYNILHTNILAM